MGLGDPNVLTHASKIETKGEQKFEKRLTSDEITELIHTQAPKAAYNTVNYVNHELKPQQEDKKTKKPTASINDDVLISETSEREEATPPTYSEAMHDVSRARHWKWACEAEVNSMIKHGVYKV